MTDNEALALIERAQKDGDTDAQRAVALHCYEKYLMRLKMLFKISDPAVSYEDLQMTFFEGIMRAVLIVDERGNPLYHIGQRGMWNVGSEIRTVSRQMKHRARLPRVDEDGEPRGIEVEDELALEAFGRADDQMDAEQFVHIITTAPLRTRLRRVVEIVISGAAGDPTEKGFNQRLAGQLQVSPQRASQLMRELRETVDEP
jgi:hypothetical protein